VSSSSEILPAKPLKPGIEYLKSGLVDIEAVKLSSASEVTSPLSFTIYFPGTASAPSTLVSGAARVEESRMKINGINMFSTWIWWENLERIWKE